MERGNLGAFLSALARPPDQFHFTHMYQNSFYIAYNTKKRRKSAIFLFTKDFTKCLFLLQSPFLFTLHWKSSPIVPCY